MKMTDIKHCEECKYNSLFCKKVEDNKGFNIGDKVKVKDYSDLIYEIKEINGQCATIVNSEHSVCAYFGLSSLEKTIDIDYLVNQELARASEKYGNTFNSMHEAYSVIKEELEETVEQLDMVDAYLTLLWIGIKDNSSQDDIVRYLNNIELRAKMVIEEAARVCAMARKASKSLE